VNTHVSSSRWRRVPSRKRAIVVSLVVGVGLGLAALALTRLDLSHSLHALTNVRPGFVALTFALLCVSLIARAECWFVILRGAGVSTRINRLVTARATMIGVMVSATLPGRLGEPARVFVVARRTGDPRNWIALVAGTVLAIGFIVSFNSGMLVLTGGPLIMVLAYTVRKVPFAVRSASAIVHQIDASLEEGPWRRPSPTSRHVQGGR